MENPPLVLPPGFVVLDLIGELVSCGIVGPYTDESPARIEIRDGDDQSIVHIYLTRAQIHAPHFPKLFSTVTAQVMGRQVDPLHKVNTIGGVCYEKSLWLIEIDYLNS